MTHIVLASSPLVGAAALAPLADALRHRGHTAALPAAPADLDAHVAAFSGQTAGAALVVYSAAGPRSHLLARAFGASAIVYLDAHLPVDGGAPDDDPRLRAFLDELPLDDAGRLPPWTEWWPAAVLAALVPDAGRRHELAASCPRVPRGALSQPVGVPPFAGPSGFVLLSESYRPAASTAAARGWPVAEIADGTHLSPFVEPEPVADALVSMISSIVERSA